MRNGHNRDRETALERIGMVLGGGLVLAALSGQLYFIGWLVLLP